MRFVVALTPEQYRRYLEKCFKLFIIGAALFAFFVFFVKGTNYIKGLIHPEVVSESVSNKEIKSLTQKIKAYPKKVELYTEREKLYLEKKDYLNAIEDLNKQIELQGNSHINTYHCYKRIIKIYTDQRQYQKAIDTYSDLFKCNDYIGKDYTNRGFLYLLTGRVDLALNDFKTASQKRQ